MLFGAVIGSDADNIPSAIILAFLGHYFLDLSPHIEYSIDNIRSKERKKSLPDILKAVLDFPLKITIVYLISNNWLIIYTWALIAIVPDGLTLMHYAFTNIFELRNAFWVFFSNSRTKI